ncbi:MAG: glycoside hydrolase family 88 protein [Clostridia bacterium]|nr:glycoside hydrolase family 88 protein [Clostridia bacterium]
MEIQKLLDLCVNKTAENLKKMPFGLREYPSASNGNYFDVEIEKTKSFDHIMNWTASFFSGMAILSFEKTRDLSFLKWLNKQYCLYYSKVFDNPCENMHDMGFLYSLYSVGMYRLTGDLNHLNTAIKAADELAKRFVPEGGYIRAWGRMDDKVGDYISAEDAENHFFTQSKGLAIIDCLMNLPLLFFASEQTGNNFYKSIAVKHADTVLKYFIRDDYSVYHSFRFDECGNPAGGCNYCGYSDESFWARGTTWAIYGFAIAYGYTGKERYLDAAVRLGQKFIENLDEDGIPAWDFRMPDDEPKNADSSAAAIAVCGFMQILKYKDVPQLRKYVDIILNTLSDKKYTNFDVYCPGLLKNQNGQNTYTIYGDYFYMEALYRKAGGEILFW